LAAAEELEKRTAEWRAQLTQSLCANLNAAVMEEAEQQKQHDQK